MNRRAVIFSASPNSSFRNRFAESALECFQFLSSKIGGAWRGEEIVQLADPSRQEILSIVHEAKSVDYFLVFFWGGGELQKLDRPWREIRLRLPSGESISEQDLNPGAPYIALICDCNNSITLRSRNSKSDRISAESENCDYSIVKQFYEKSLNSAEQGFVKIFSDEKSSLSITHSLIEASRVWALDHKGILKIDQAVKLAVSTMKRDERMGAVEYHGGRRSNHFPFAVSI